MELGEPDDSGRRRPIAKPGSDFIIATQSVARTKSKVKKLEGDEGEIDYSGKFSDMVLELLQLYQKFPKYLLEIKAEDYGIPAIELQTLIRNAKKSGELIKSSIDDTYSRSKRK